MTEIRTLLVNRADWDAPADVPAGWHVANAPRPIRGEVTWTGQFRHGIFYAASSCIPEGTWGWAADDAWLIELTDNDAIMTAVLAKAAEHGYGSLDAMTADGITAEGIAIGLQLPWCERPCAHAGGPCSPAVGGCLCICAGCASRRVESRGRSGNPGQASI